MDLHITSSQRGVQPLRRPVMDLRGPAKPPEKRKVGGSTSSQSPSGDWPGQKPDSTRVQHLSRPRTRLKAVAAQRLATTTINALAALEFASRGSLVRQLALGSPDLIPEIHRVLAADHHRWTDARPPRVHKATHAAPDMPMRELSRVRPPVRNVLM
jgi:hypothetical protein